MAVPGLAGWQDAILGGLGAPASPQNLAFLNAWARAEGGVATNNPFNTTLSTPQATGSINSVGVRNYATPQAGIQATIDTLKNGNYGGILAALQKGTSAMDAAQAVANSPWGTGSGVVRVLGGSSQAPQTPSSQTPGGGIPAMPAAAQVPSSALKTSRDQIGAGVVGGLMSGNLLGGLMGQAMGQPLSPLGGSNMNPLSLALGQSLKTSTPPPGPPSNLPTDFTGQPPVTAGGLGKVSPGDPVPGKFQTSVGGEHPTEGLAGYPAHDYFAKAGSPTVAPVSGTVIRLSGHDPSQGPIEGPHGPFGWSVYIQGDNGATYYLTHMGSRDVKPGEQVKAGQVIGSVGDYAEYGTPSHIHMGVKSA